MTMRTKPPDPRCSRPAATRSGRLSLIVRPFHELSACLVALFAIL